MNGLDFYIKYIEYHELIGLNVEVINKFSSLENNIKGIIVDETKNMFKIKTYNNNIILIPKHKNSFKFKIKSVENIYIEINGDKLISRPENRTKNLKKRS